MNKISIIQACEDPHIFRPLFKDPATWRPWRVFLCALFGLPVTDEADLRLFIESTGLGELPHDAIREVTAICGRRSGKSFISALIAVYMACFRDWSAYLSPGERGMVFIVANDKMQASIIKHYISAILDQSDMLRRMVKDDKAESIDLTNRITIQVKTNSFRTIRGYSCICAILEESAYWRSELSANPDREVLAAIRPALSTIPESLLISISTPYSRRGILWDSFKKNYGQPGRTLVWKQKSTTMNPTLDQALIDQALAEDPVAAAAEWLTEWRSDVESFLSFEALEACVATGRAELPPVKGVQYTAAIDPSFLGQDSWTLAIAHSEAAGQYQLLDMVREWKPGTMSPEKVVDECVALCRAYGVTRVWSDRFSRDWVREKFKEQGMDVWFNKKSSSELYLDLLPLVTARSIELLDHKRLVGQLANLERRTRPGGLDLIIHFPSQHDDLAAAAASALVQTTMRGATWRAI